MQTQNRSGFEPTIAGLYISKDPEAQLIYTFDWSEWLNNADTVTEVEYTAVARRNDPTPITVVSSGIAQNNTHTYVELSGGQLDKTYIVTAKVTTSDGLVDRRNFRVKIVNRAG